MTSTNFLIYITRKSDEVGWFVDGNLCQILDTPSLLSRNCSNGFYNLHKFLKTALRHQRLNFHYNSTDILREEKGETNRLML
jgi:hypothetical protein